MTAMRKTLALTWMARQDALGYKGKAADRACLEFWLGAWTALDAIKHPEAGNIGNIAGLLIAIRGAKECKRIADAPDMDEAQSNAPLVQGFRDQPIRASEPLANEHETEN